METTSIEISLEETRSAEELRTQEIYNQIIHEAPYIPGDSGVDLRPEDIPWANPQLIQQGQDFIQRNNFSVVMAHMVALVYGFSFKRLTTVLLRTGGFGLGDPHTSLLRHIQTGIHIDKWYSTNVLDSESKGFKDIQLVRKLHFGALRKCAQTPLRLVEKVPREKEKRELIAAIKSDLDVSCETTEAEKNTELFTYSPVLLFSQFDMLMTQFGFISIIFLFPETLGIRDTSGIQGYLHMWAIFGKLLGIEDRFNLALNPNLALLRKIFHTLGIPNLKTLDLNILHLCQTYLDGACGPLVSLKSLLYYGLSQNQEIPEFKGEQFQKLLTISDRIRLGIIRFILFLVFHFEIFRQIMNKLHFLHSNYMERKYFPTKIQGK